MRKTLLTPMTGKGFDLVYGPDAPSPLAVPIRPWAMEAATQEMHRWSERVDAAQRQAEVVIGEVAA